MQLPTFSRIVAGIVSPVAVSMTALVLDQTGLYEISWVAGTIVVVVLAGLVCGILLRSALASAYIFVLWLVWAVLVLLTHDGSGEMPAGASVLIVLLPVGFPAAFGAFVGGLALSAWSERSRTRQNRSV